MAFFKTNKTNKRLEETQIVWKNSTADRQLNTKRKYAGFFTLDGKESLVVIESTSRIAATDKFEDLAKELGGKFNNFRPMK